MRGARPIVLRMTRDPAPSVGESGGFRFVWRVLAFFSVIIVVLSWASSTDVAALMSVMLLVSGLAQAIRASRHAPSTALTSSCARWGPRRCRLQILATPPRAANFAFKVHYLWPFRCADHFSSLGLYVAFCRLRQRY